MEFSENRDTYANIATLYYLGDLSQEEVAKIYNISRFKVSRILKKCKVQKIVTFQINASESRADTLAEQLKNKLGIEHVIIAPSGATEIESKNNVGKATAEYIQTKLHDNMTVGFSWGSTIQTLPRYFTPEYNLENLTLVQLCGSICSNAINEQGYMDGSEIIRHLADKISPSANRSFFQVPYIVNQPALREMLLHEAIIASHVEQFEKLDLVCLGVGSSIPAKSVAYLSGYISLAESQQMVKNGYGADICGIRLAKSGEPAHTILDQRVLTISPDVLQTVPQKIAIASGPDKACSIVSGVRGNLVNAVVLDEIAAISTLHYLEEE